MNKTRISKVMVIKIESRYYQIIRINLNNSFYKFKYKFRLIEYLAIKLYFLDHLIIFVKRNNVEHDKL